MKIGGKKIDARPSSDFIIFPRDGMEHGIGFRATALLDRSEFDRLCPAPKPGKMRVRGQSALVENFDDPKYRQRLETYNKQFMDYMFIASLSGIAEVEGDPDPEIEWEKVKRHDRNTWHLYDEELKDIGLSDMERKRLFNMVMGVNALNDNRLDEARKSFLQRASEQPDESSSPTDEQTDTPSGEPANGQESDSQDAQPVGTNSTQA